jgi:hypothetical protein
MGPATLERTVAVRGERTMGIVGARTRMRERNVGNVLAV